jgi:hypothetical protein
MSNNYETGKVILNSEINEITIGFVNSYNQKPVIKITADENVNVFIKDVTASNFKIVKSDSVQANVHYIAIER